MRKILVLNLGSTSFKFKLYNMGGEETFCLWRRGKHRHRGGLPHPGKRQRGERALPGVKRTSTRWNGAWPYSVAWALPVDMASLDAVGYKAVHGGSISGSRVVDDTLMAEMERMCALAPAHNPVYLEMMRRVQERYPGLTQIACFETAFSRHDTLGTDRVRHSL